MFYLRPKTTNPWSPSTDLLGLLCAHSSINLQLELTGMQGWGALHRAVVFGTIEDVIILLKQSIDSNRVMGRLHRNGIHSGPWGQFEAFHVAAELLHPIYEPHP
jgi:hypothetical protein